MKDVKNVRFPRRGQQESSRTYALGSAIALITGMAVIIFGFTVLPKMSKHFHGMPSAQTLVQNEIGRVNNACAKGHQKECAYLDATRQ